MDPYKEVWQHVVLLRELLNKRLTQRESEWGLTRADTHKELQVALGILEYSGGLLQNLQRLQSESESSFHDVTIKVSDKVFHAHRTILAAASPYFETMFTSQFKESFTREIELKDIDSNIFEMLFNFIYSGKMNLSVDTAREAFHVAKYLQIRYVESFFIDFWLETMDYRSSSELPTEEALVVLEIAEEHDMDDLHEKCMIYLLQRFHWLMKMDTYEESVPCKVMRKFLSFGAHGRCHDGEEKVCMSGQKDNNNK